MSPIRKDIPITNPEDSRFKLQNEIRILAYIIDIATVEVTRQRWIQEGLTKVALLAQLKKKRELETAAVDDKPVKQDNRERLSMNAVDDFFDVISNLKISIQSIISHARDVAIKVVDAQIKDPVTNAMAKNIVAKVFNNELVQQSSDVLQKVAGNNFNLDAELAKAHPLMHESIKRDHEELQSAVKARDSQKALEKAITLQASISYGQGMQTELKREIILVAALEPTPEQRLRVEQENANTIRVTSPDVAWVGYADKEGKFAEVEVKDDSQLRCLKEAFSDPDRLTKEHIHKVVDDIVASTGATSVGNRLEAQEAQIRELYHTALKNIIDDTAKKISEDVLSAENKSPFDLEQTAAPSSDASSVKADGTSKDILGNDASPNSDPDSGMSIQLK